MSFVFKKHYTKEEAEALLPKVREWFGEIELHRPFIMADDEQLEKLMNKGVDVGGEILGRYYSALAKTQAVLAKFKRLDIQVKDIDRWLIDFPAIKGGREVFLCWEKDEENIEYWHDLESGYAGRERLW